jgi:hypothetical protein
MQHLYLLRRKYSNVYYTIRNSSNVPSAIAFTCKDKANRFMKIVKFMEVNKQPMVVECVPEDFILHQCDMTSLSLSVFDYFGDYDIDSRTIMTSANDNDVDDAKFYLENKYRYFS